MTLPTLRSSALLFILQAAVLSGATDSSRASEVLRTDESRVKAILQGDAAALERLYADELVYIHANGRIDTKAGYLASLRSGGLTYVSLEYSPAPQVQITGDTAVVTGRATIEVKNRAGQLTKRVLTTTTIYARTSSGWKIVSYQGTPAT